MNYDSIKINDEEVDFVLLQQRGKSNLSHVDRSYEKHSPRRYQETFFTVFLKSLYVNGLNIMADEQYISDQIALFLLEKKSTFLGSDILFCGSDEGWDICNRVLKKTYPALFTSVLTMHKGGGISLKVNIRDSKNYTISSRSNFYIQENISDERLKLRNLKKIKDLASLTVHWTCYWSEDGGWRWKIKFSNFKKLNATPEQYLKILMTFNTPLEADCSAV
jgi:hypothetical protein